MGGLCPKCALRGLIQLHHHPSGPVGVLLVNVRGFGQVTHKVAVVRTLMSRANTLSSSGVQRVEEKKIVDAHKENGYPSRFIRKHSYSTRHRQEVDEVGAHIELSRSS